MTAHAASALLVAVALSACSSEDETAVEETRSPSAQPHIAEALRADLAAVHHASDGGGRAWIESGPMRVPASESATWTLVYEAGPHGIAVGGQLFFQVSPFWGWSTPQVVSEGAPGFTTVTTESGASLEPRTLDQQLLGIEVSGRPLAEGERVALTYGAGPMGAVVDRYAGARSRFWFAVDGDGDGVRRLVADPPAVSIDPGPAAMVVVVLPSTAQVGEVVELSVSVLDEVGNRGVPFEGELALSADGVELPAVLRFSAEAGGVASLSTKLDRPGIVRVRAEGPGPLSGESNPLVVGEPLPRLLWGDVHGHSGLTDGTGTPEDYLAYARDVARLDVVALTDHDHWGMRPLSQEPEAWQEIREATERLHQPGRFVTLLGFEWTSWLHGHRHVLYFGREGRVLSSVDPAYERPEQLWAALRGQPALTFAHHSAGGPVATNWEIPPDPELEPVTEIASVHGSSESDDAPRLIYRPVAGNFVRDALDRGYRLGLIGSGDSHDGHPGLVHLDGGAGGLAGIFATAATREGVLEALRARRVYATNGPRIVLYASLDGVAMGASVASREKLTLEFRVVATAPLERVDLVRSGRVVESIDAGGALELSESRILEGSSPGEYLYLRAVQADRGAAWTSPFFLR